MNPAAKPNTFQKFIHRFLMLKWMSAFLAVVLYRLDGILLKLTGDKHTVTEIVGLPIIQLTTIGAKTGEPRTMPLVSLVDGEKIALVGSNFGRKPNPGWYYNLKANPTCTVHYNGRTSKYIARQTVETQKEFLLVKESISVKILKLLIRKKFQEKFLKIHNNYELS